ncbi:hypothetical protein B7P43_G05453 [Cryptotermes secundus]|uniref:Endonuclease/exonuclease/phosphatase domain-containing protein n=1 Tax=Cryptotermes secundus TaxID=105785 RepID=A0A2J7QIB8_9NEOP|nr:hypothetical protein B7P43_G05453 [Cryptotermes secundus]
MKFLQINLHHRKAATAALCHQLAEEKAHIALIQEAWIYNGKIRGLTNTGGTGYSAVPSHNARSCVYIKNHVNALPLLELYSRDTSAVRITYLYRGGSKELFVASVYLPYDSDEPPPTKEMRAIIDYRFSRKKQLIIECDDNAHHNLWGNTGTNGENLMEFLVSSNLNILNHGNQPTFVVCNRKEVTDLTLGTNNIGNLVSNWHVSDEPSLSDHRYICFKISNIRVDQVTYRNPKRTNWESYKDDIKVNLGTISRNIRTIKDVDRSVDQFQGLLSRPLIRILRLRPLTG